MAKAPTPGRSKTRLCPPLTPEEAAGLSAAFLRDMAATLRRAGTTAPIDGYVAYAPAGAAAALRPLIAPHIGLLLADGAGVHEPGVRGFGCVLLQTLRALLGRGYGAACVLNADSPTLPAAIVQRAAAILATKRIDRIVVGPAPDGGYYLLGARVAYPALFANIAWSTPTVAAQTLHHARRSGLHVLCLPPWYDIDDAPSLRLALADLAVSTAPASAPATAAAFAQIDLRQRLA